MARKTQIVTITAAGRDHGKAFLLTEMPATKAERWAGRGLAVLLASGLSIPDEMLKSGMAGLSVIPEVERRLFVNVNFEEIEPLLVEMFECIQILPDPATPSVVRALIEDDIEEVATRIYLRSEVVALHLGFSFSGILSSLGALLRNAKSRSSNTQTPPEPLEPSSPPDSPV